MHNLREKNSVIYKKCSIRDDHSSISSFSKQKSFHSPKMPCNINHSYNYLSILIL